MDGYAVEPALFWDHNVVLDWLALFKELCVTLLGLGGFRDMLARHHIDAPAIDFDHKRSVGLEFDPHGFSLVHGEENPSLLHHVAWKTLSIVLNLVRLEAAEVRREFRQLFVVGKSDGPSE